MVLVVELAALVMVLVGVVVIGVDGMLEDSSSGK
jgi:hypothetical protein